MTDAASLLDELLDLRERNQAESQLEQKLFDAVVFLLRREQTRDETLQDG